MRAFTILLGAALLGFTVACGGGSTEDATSQNEPMDDTTGSEMEAEAPTADIVDTAVAAGSFSTLVAAVQAAGLEETLRGEGPFTVFAPTDEAFAALPAGTVDNLLLPENREQLVAVLTYHVVAGQVTSDEVVNLSAAPTVNGAELSIDASDGVKIGGANVVQADVMASNGVIHVIDSVLLPPQ